LELTIGAANFCTAAAAADDADAIDAACVGGRSTDASSSYAVKTYTGVPQACGDHADIAVCGLRPLRCRVALLF